MNYMFLRSHFGSSLRDKFCCALLFGADYLETWWGSLPLVAPVAGYFDFKDASLSLSGCIS
jgi:hypothetical protein